MNQAEYVRTTYGVPAKRGMRVTVDGVPGVITSFRDGKIRVRFDGRRHSVPAHPTWRADYDPGDLTMRLSYLLETYRPGSYDPPWDWDDEEDDILSNPCPTEMARADGVDVDPCDDPEPGCYQRKLEAYLRSRGGIEQGVCLGDDGRIWDGHHRIVAARRLGFDQVPIER
jgi:hypothetical protein